MASNIKKLFQKSLKIDSIYKESENDIPSSNEISNSRQSHLEEFKKQSSSICIFPLNIRENYSGNYGRYIEKTLTHISELQNIKFEYALEDPTLYDGVPNLSSNKKILLLDLDETLIHADFDEKYVNEKYDAIIKFKASSEEKEKNDIHGENENDSTCSVSGEEEEEMIH